MRRKYLAGGALGPCEGQDLNGNADVSSHFEFGTKLALDDGNEWMESPVTTLVFSRPEASSKMKTNNLVIAAAFSLSLCTVAAKAQATPETAPQITSQNTVTATGQPLETQSHEGFWGHLNPFARKTWVHRQVDPIADRANELDELQAKNAHDIKDVDARATAGVGRAMDAAGAADAHAADAQGRADHANSLAVTADGRTTELNGTVSTLDQYQQVSSKAMAFTAGRTALTAKQKADLDEVADSLAAEKGYIVEVEGYSRGGVTSSQAMADSVVRYLVVAHQVPVYRIYRTGLGAQKLTTDASVKPISNGVRVTVLHNSLATMGSNSTTPSAARGTMN